MRRLLLTSLLIAPLFLQARTVDVRVLSTMNVTTVNVYANTGRYELYFDSIRQPDSLTGKVFQLILTPDSAIEVRIPGDTLGKIHSFRLLSLDDSCSFKIKPIHPFSGTRIYDHTLTIDVFNNTFRCINRVGLEHYVAGVVETEAGDGSLKEFYKVQAIICRTYALGHSDRHALDGFDLCDGVHCQAYHGRPANPLIQEAVDETAGMVLVDRGLNLIVASFFSNCGGQTANSEDVWAVALPYLRSVKDTFCLHQPHAYWTRKIAREDWLKYLSVKMNYPVNDSAACRAAMNMKQYSRGTDFVYGNIHIPYKTIRSDWQLRSAYFSTELHNDTIVIHGRGYGHGVGLCQEGAMHMAELNCSYDTILHFYYRDVDIIDLSKLAFFQGE